jgi:hypothetical protein
MNTANQSKKAGKKCVVAAEIIGEPRMGIFMIEHALDGVFWRARKMILEKTEEVSEMIGKFYCVIKTEFQETLQEGIVGYAFNVKIKRHNQSCVIKMVVAPSDKKVPEIPRGINWKSHESEQLNLLELAQEAYGSR